MVDRRTFLGFAAVGWMSACASVVTTPVTPEHGVIRLTVKNHPTLDRPGGFLKIRPVGSDAMLYVLALEGGEFAVVSPICKHLGCTVGIEATRLLCPCHGSMYGRDGAVLRGPTQEPLDRFPAALSADGILTINLQSLQ